MSCRFGKKQIDKRLVFSHRVPSRFKRLYEFFESVGRAVTEIWLHKTTPATRLKECCWELKAVPNTDWRSVDDLRR